MSWFMPWLGPWWSWLASWFVWPGFGVAQQPFGPFMPPPDPTGQTLQFAETRAAFWRHWFEAQAEIFRQAANYAHVPGYPGYPCAPGAGPVHPPQQRVDLPLLKDALKPLPEAQAAFVLHAVQVLEAWDGMRQQGRSGPDW
jgi:hypothetical protein